MEENSHFERKRSCHVAIPH